MIRRSAQGTPKKAAKPFRSPRLTPTGVRVLLQYVAGPILLVLLAMDIALYFIFKVFYNSCYGVLCLF